MLYLWGYVRAYIRFYFEKNNKKWKNKVTFTTYLFVGMSSLMIVLLLLPFIGLFKNFINEINDEKLLLIILLSWLPFEALLNVGLTSLQIEMKSIIYVAVSISKLLLIIVSIVVLVYIFRFGVIGIIFTNLWVSFLLSIILIIEIPLKANTILT